MEFEPIGTVHTPFNSRKGMPIQPTGGRGVKGRVELHKDFLEGLQDLTGFSHIILIYHFHRSGAYKLTVQPFLDNKPHGVFATRAPSRPNAIGLSVVRLTDIRENILEIEDVDILNGTPLLDIKPYIDEFDRHFSQKQGWLSDNAKKARRSKSDERFI
jgi:tRNA-Thr(GGU) m(6)t(6)A37 methyltransferase TsaA